MKGTTKQVRWAKEIAQPAIELFPELRNFDNAEFWIENREVPYPALELYRYFSVTGKYGPWKNPYTWDMKVTTTNSDKSVRVDYHLTTDLYRILLKKPSDALLKVAICVEEEGEGFRFRDKRDFPELNSVIWSRIDLPNGWACRDHLVAIVGRKRKGYPIKFWAIWDKK